MKSRLRNRFQDTSGEEINMTPLIDMVFILLIFFLVTTSFVREAGVEVNRPAAKSARTEEQANLIVAVTADGSVHTEGKRIDIRSLRARVQRFLADLPNGSVVVVADRETATGTTIRVLDICRLAGVKNISVAARKE
jgi:biopolymer transport protein ExbD